MKQKFKKFTAISLAATLGLTAAPSAAFAQSYTEIEKAALTKAISEFTVNYAKEFEEYDALKTGIREDMTLTLDDAGRSLLGFLVPLDLSWFQDLRISGDISMDDGAQFMNAGLYLNDTKICTIEYFFDMENMEIYMRIPELRDGYIKVDYEEAMKQQKEALEQQEEALEENGGNSEIDPAAEEALEALEDSPMNDPEFMKAYMAVLSDLPEYLPEASKMEELLNKYSSLLFDHLEEGEPAAETLELSGFTSDCQMYEGRLSQSQAQTFFKDLIETAKADEEIKSILEKLDEKLTTTDHLYQDFLKALEDAAEDLNEEIEDDGSYMSAKVWVDENGDAQRRSLALCEADETTSIYDWMELSNGNDIRTSLLIGSGDDSLEFSGEGTLTNGILTGEYTFSAGDSSTPSEPGEKILITVNSYDTKAAKEGSFYGNYTLSLPPADGSGLTPEESAQSNPLQYFALNLDLASDTDTGKVEISVENAGASLARLTTEATLGVTVEKPDFEDLADVYDSLDENAMNDYMSEVALDTILENLVDAGMPEELLMQLLSGGASPEAGMEALPEGVPSSDAGL